MRRTLGIVVMLGIGFTACTSPEATRVRAGGPGADPFWKTPRVAGIKGPALDPARQADQLSRR